MLWVGALAAVVVAAIVIVGVALGRPHVTWSLRRADNQLTVALAPGAGPLAPWLLTQSTLVSGAGRGSRMSFTLQPGRTSTITVGIAGLWSSAQEVAVAVPPLPAVVSTRVDSRLMALHFSMPVKPRDAPCGLPAGLSWITTLAFPRRTQLCSSTLDVVAELGEQAQIPLSIPATPTAPPQRPVHLPPPAPEVFFGPPVHGAVYITIDDGWYPDSRVIALMQRDHLPLTTFLTAHAAARHLPFWRAFVAAGGEIDDHTMSHPNLTLLSDAGAEGQWAAAAHEFETWFGVTPLLGRPPYGYVDRSVDVAAAQAGLRQVVLWSAVMANGQLSTYDGGPLHAGEIVILHWVPGLYGDLVHLLGIVQARGLHPAPLGVSLEQGG